MQWSKLLRPVVLAYVLWLAQALGFPGPVVLACVPLLADCRLGKAADLVGVDTVVLCLTSNVQRNLFPSGNYLISDQFKKCRFWMLSTCVTFYAVSDGGARATISAHSASIGHQTRFPG
jgi:hypothetical protein